MAKLERAAEEQSLQMESGKFYTPVAARLKVFRQSFGMDLGISTEVKVNGFNPGDTVLCKAVISDSTGRILSSGHALEVISEDGINEVSAVEAGETSAVGRALAILGLAGSELASQNEMERVPEKQRVARKTRPAEEAPTKDNAPEAVPEFMHVEGNESLRRVDTIPESMSKLTDMIVAMVPKAETPEQLDKLWKINGGPVKLVKQKDEGQYSRLVDVFKKAKSKLMEKETDGV